MRTKEELISIGVQKEYLPLEEGRGCTENENDTVLHLSEFSKLLYITINQRGSVEWFVVITST